MAFIFKEKRRKPIPEGAEILRRKGGKVAKWESNGRAYTAAVDGESIIIEGHVFYARWRDAGGIVRTESTGCRGADMAQKWLDARVKESERITAGVVSLAESRTAEKSSGAITETAKVWKADMKSKGRSVIHVRECGNVINKVADACGWKSLRDMERNALEKYLQLRRDADGISARTYNKHIALVHAFGRWCQRRGLLMVNPFQGMEHLNQKTDVRRQRRTLTAVEVNAIVTTARTRATDSWKGENRATAYRLMGSTGLRWNEARTLRLSDIHLEGKTPYIQLQAGNAKSRKDARVPLHNAVVDELASFIAQRKKTLTGDCGASIVTFPGLAKDAPLFDDLPKSISVVFAADVKGAGIASPDERGRVVDAHCLRYHFASQLAASGCPVHILQKLMRHSTVDLSMRVYVHSTLDDLSGAVQRVKIGADVEAEKQAAASAGNAETHTTSNPTLPDGETVQKGALFGIMRDSITGGLASRINTQNPCFTGVSGDILPSWASGGIGIHDGLKIHSVSPENPINTGVPEGEGAHTTSNPTLTPHQNAHLDGIRAALSGLTRDELLTLLADALADGKKTQ
jgi:integrase